MELKDMVLSTLAEIEDDKVEEEMVKKADTESFETKDMPDDDYKIAEEDQFLKNLRERILVLFEGFKAPNNANIEAKVDLTLNFLEYLLATIDERLKDKES